MTTYFVSKDDLGAGATDDDAMEFASLVEDVFAHVGLAVDVEIGAGGTADGEAVEIGNRVFDLWCSEGTDEATRAALIRAQLLPAEAA